MEDDRKNRRRCWPRPGRTGTTRSEEHTSELQSQSNLVCRLLLEKKKTVLHIVTLRTEHQVLGLDLLRSTPFPHSVVLEHALLDGYDRLCSVMRQSLPQPRVSPAL